jgi:hypothetical protein
MLVSAGISLMLTTSVWADCRKKINLTVTSPGAASDSSGTAEVRQQGAQQRFKLSMDSRVPDGTTYVVKANNLTIGAIVISLGDGELDLNNQNGKTLPSGINPACSVGPVSVTDGAGNVILMGSF